MQLFKKHTIIELLILCLLFINSIASTEQLITPASHIPSFNEYHVSDIYKGSITNIDFASMPKAKKYKTILSSPNGRNV